jgi:hypothetical protein
MTHAGVLGWLRTHRRTFGVPDIRYDLPVLSDPPTID